MLWLSQWITHHYLWLISWHGVSFRKQIWIPTVLDIILIQYYIQNCWYSNLFPSPSPIARCWCRLSARSNDLRDSLLERFPKENLAWKISQRKLKEILIPVRHLQVWGNFEVYQPLRALANQWLEGLRRGSASTSGWKKLMNTWDMLQWGPKTFHNQQICLIGDVQFNIVVQPLT